MKYILLTFLSITFIAAHHNVAQTIRWDTKPKTGFVFRISNKEAQKLLTKSRPDTIVATMLHTQIDTFNVDRGWKNRPDKGHFILARIIENKLHCEYTSVFPYQVLLLKEYDALSLQVLGLDGNVKDKAKVKFKGKRIAFDPLTKTYRVENQWFRGSSRIVTVELDGFRSVFNIKKHDVPEWDHYNSYDDDGPDFYSYMITDKNRYKPGERVRFKSYALTGSKHPMRRDLQVTLWNRGRPVNAGTVSPHRPGGYAGEIQLHDSLNLTLDQHYQLQLSDKRGRVVANCSFYYEDYELSGKKLKVDITTDKQFHPASNTVSITATDENGLMLKDARAAISVLTRSVDEIFAPVVIIPDTLLFKEIPLAADAPTTLDIPSSLFKEANVNYVVRVTVLNSENERLDYDIDATHLYSNYALTSAFYGDSIRFVVTKNGEVMENVPMLMYRDEEPKATAVTLPYQEKINPALKTIEFKGDVISRSFTMAKLLPNLTVLGGVEKDSFNIKVLNPQKLAVSWYVYQGSLLLAKGFGTDVSYQSKIEDWSNSFYVELLYSFGGTDHVTSREFVLRKNSLAVEVNLPDRVYPGQKVDATIRVSDAQGLPAKNVDLTAFATTAKLDYFAPNLPFYGPTSAARPEGATFDKHDLTKRSAILDLDYKRWAKPAGLDTMKYYRLIYPDKEFMQEVSSSDSTQFSIFIMKNGSAKKVYVIEIDRRPVYYSWTHQPASYSFYVVPDQPTEVSLRLHDRVIVLDSLCFSAGKKTIISLDYNRMPKRADVIRFNAKKIKVGLFRSVSRWSFTAFEESRHSKLVANFPGTRNHSYITSGKEFVPLSVGSSPGNTVTAGPITPGMQTYVELERVETTYRHAPGFSYRFEDNIVYKTDATNLLPKYLTDETFSPIMRIYDLPINKKRFLRRPSITEEKWHPSVIHLLDQKLHLKILLPYEKAQSGVAAVLFEDCKTGAIVSPCKNYRTSSENFNIPKGCYNTIVIYENGMYLKADKIEFKPYTTVVVDMNVVAHREADETSQRWLLERNRSCLGSSVPVSRTIIIHQSRSGYGNVRGRVFSVEDGLPLPGVNVVERGTTNGTVTDEQGSFGISITHDPSTLVFTFIGLQTIEVNVSPRDQIEVAMQADIAQLSEVVVTGYSEERTTKSLAYSTALAGKVAGIAIDGRDPEEDEGTTPPEVEEQQDAEKKLYNDLLNLKTIRSNFSDVAFWEPKLFTDRHGESKFSVTFPDDVTRWDAVIYAMNRHLQTATLKKSIRAYKPLMAQLSVPRFLTLGDSADAVGKVLNYTSDKTIDGTVEWRGFDDAKKAVSFGNFYAQKIFVSPLTTDTISASYSFTRSDGYYDGEQRKIPVVPQGTVRAEGTLSLLQNNDEVQVTSKKDETVYVEIMANQLEFYSQNIQNLIHYRYDCNEQLASKLIGLLNAKLIARFEGKTFDYDKDIKRIITRLLKNQNAEFLWSWWDVSPNTSYWMSAHVLRALKAAQDAGYTVKLDLQNLMRKATYRYDYVGGITINDVELVHALALWNADINYQKYLPMLERSVFIADSSAKAFAKRYKTTASSVLYERLLLLELRQVQHIPFVQDSLLRYKKQTLLNAVYFTDERPSRWWYTDDLLANAVAYRIASRDSTLRAMTTQMQLYFISSKEAGRWNTYQSSNVTMSVLQDLIAIGARKDALGIVTVSGKHNERITKFPYKTDLHSGEALTLKKESGVPLYFMQYHEERVTIAKAGTDGFTITSGFNDKELKAGKPTVLSTWINVKRDAKLDHVMVEIPIPAGCSYADKQQPYSFYETHREFFKEKVVIFCENLREGNYRFDVNLLPRFTGNYHVNPAQVSLMYFPVINANTAMQKIGIRD